ncbi:hypothetical protein MPSYJ_50120 [Mycolicibacterium psychrotolerans]|uniref:Methyltransferase FkbM domain-containing protein n=2 Tax=Mycolicibacterium psychrotolerans TaxID=216929 RepID=A0A7I7MGT4_9MYCO|nr:hypothetical protein MPSYJ_50120 [Mycolicibacterium psychrotolerans]
MRNFIDEAEIIAQLAPDSTGNGLTLVDVGAHHGAVTSLFVDKGWSAVAYEPDPANRELFERRIGRHPRVQLSSSAVSDTGAESASLFTSSVSTGISTLSAFHDSHIPTAAVKVVTLAEDLRSRRIARVDFLKIDIEGFDFFALKGFDWNYAPRFVLFEFEDRKTTALGYSLADSSEFMIAHGYHLVYSVWEPIVEYGRRHFWRGLSSTIPADADKCWGNVLAFYDEADALRCTSTFGRRLV